MDHLRHYDTAISWQAALISMLLAFVLCHLVAAVYGWTYRGLSYSKGFVHSLVFAGPVATFLMLAIGDNIARGMGLLGTMALIRYRATLKDSRDLVFVFSSLAVGIAVGVQSYFVAIIGTVSFCLFTLHLTFSTFAGRRQFDGLIRFQVPALAESDTLCKNILSQYCSNFVLVNLWEVAQGRVMEHAYQMKLKVPSYHESLILALRTAPEVAGVCVLLQDQRVEL